MPGPSLTIATISLNQGQFLNAAIESVLEQNYPIEYLIIDAGSTDNTPTILDRYQDDAVIVIQADDGPADGLNTALALATGELFAWVNADDILLPGAVAAAVAAFDRRPGADVIYGDGLIIDEKGEVLRRVRSDRFGIRRYAYGGAVILQPAAFIRTCCAKEIGGFNPQNHTSWDGELFLEIALAGGAMWHVAQEWAAFRLHAGSISGSQRAGRMYLRDRERLFVRAMGRPRRRCDAVAELGWRAGKTIRNGLGTWRSRYV